MVTSGHPKPDRESSCVLRLCLAALRLRYTNLNAISALHRVVSRCCALSRQPGWRNERSTMPVQTNVTHELLTPNALPSGDACVANLRQIRLQYSKITANYMGAVADVLSGQPRSTQTLEELESLEHEFFQITLRIEIRAVIALLSQREARIREKRRILKGALVNDTLTPEVAAILEGRPATKCRTARAHACR